MVLLNNSFDNMTKEYISDVALSPGFEIFIVLADSLNRGKFSSYSLVVLLKKPKMIRELASIASA
jgi:hypothetical protein